MGDLHKNIDSNNHPKMFKGKTATLVASTHKSQKTNKMVAKHHKSPGTSSININDIPKKVNADTKSTEPEPQLVTGVLLDGTHTQLEIDGVWK